MGRRLALLVSLVLLSAAMSDAIRTTAGTVGAGSVPDPAVAVTPSSPVAAAGAAAATTAVSSEQQQQQQLTPPLDDDPYKDSRRKVPNGPDPIHNRRARWGEAPAKRV